MNPLNSGMYFDPFFSNCQMIREEGKLDLHEEEENSVEPKADHRKLERVKCLENPIPYSPEAYKNCFNLPRNFVSLSTQMKRNEEQDSHPKKVKTDRVVVNQDNLSGYKVDRDSEEQNVYSRKSETLNFSEDLENDQFDARKSFSVDERNSSPEKYLDSMESQEAASDRQSIGSGKEKSEFLALIEELKGHHASDSNNHMVRRNIIQDSIERITTMATLPRSNIRESTNGTYLNPNVTIFDINKFFEPYMSNSGYVGVSVSMSTNQIYDKTYSNRLFTAVYFKKNEKSMFNSVCHHLRTVGETFYLLSQSESGWEKRKEGLKECIFPLVEEWGYARYHIGNVNEDFFSKSETKVDYELYLLLDYKRFES